MVCKSQMDMMDNVPSSNIVTPVQMTPEILGRVAHEKLMEAVKAWNKYANALANADSRNEARHAHSIYEDLSVLSRQA